VGQERLGIVNPEVIKAVGAFGGGIASTGNVCGCLLGGVAVLSQATGKDTPQGREHPDMWRLTYKLVRRFQKLCEPYGGIECRRIAQVDWHDRDQVRAFYRGPHSRRQQHCAPLVAATAELLGRILDARDKKAGEREKE
jgi:C_GCAxxG_C_C family probable redox protein